MNRIRLLILAIGIVLLGIKASAQSAPADTAAIISEIEATGKIKINMPQSLYPYLGDTSVAVKEEAEADDTTVGEQSTRKTSRVGYRVQVFDDNNVRTAKHEAEARKRQMESRFPEFRVYMQFNSPYWRVKVGDFRTRSEADAAMAAIRSAFPGFGNQLRIVRDHINSH